MDRLDELRRRWDEQHAKIKALVAALKVKATASDEFASRYRAAQTRLAKFEEAGPPEERPPEQDLQLRLRGARTGKRAVIAEQLELTGLMKPFDLEVWFGDRVAVLGSNGSGKSHFLRLLARGGTDPDARARPRHLRRREARAGRAHRSRHPGRACRSRLVRPDPPASGVRRPHAARASCTAATRTAPACRGMPPARPSTATGSSGRRSRRFETLSGGQQARFQILLLELSGTTLLLLDEPTDNLDLVSAEALESRPGALRGHGARRHARPLVRALVRPVPRVRRRRRGLRVRRAGVGREAGRPGAVGLSVTRRIGDPQQIRTARPPASDSGALIRFCCGLRLIRDRQRRRNASAARNPGSSTRSASTAPTPGANLKPWPENPAPTTIRPTRSSTNASSGVDV